MKRTTRSETTPTLYARNATGLVRALPLWDVVLFNAASTAPVGAALAVTLFYIGSSFPRANIIAAIVAALVLCLLMWVAFALLGAAMPKVGGDYIFNGRILHPALGLAGNVAAFIAAWMAAGFWAVEGARAGVGPVLTIIGTVTGNPSWVAWGARISGDGWVFGIAAGILVILTVLSLFGTKTVVRTMSIMYLVSLVGVLISIIVMAFVSRASFVAHLNAFSAPYTHQANTYQATIASASKAGLALPSTSGFSVSSTIGAIYAVLGGAILWVWWGVYISPETRGGGRRSRQLKAILGSGYGQGLIVLIAALVFLKTVGYDFLASASAGHYGVPVPPYFNFFTAVALGSKVLAVLLSVLFVFAFFPATYINIAMCHRAPFAWAFDGIAPRKLANIDERTHTPAVAIILTLVITIPTAAWAAYSSTFATVIGLFTLFGMVTILITGFSALLMPWLRPEFYRGSEADWRILGVPVLPVAGAGAIGFAVFCMIDAAVFHTENGVSNVVWMVILPWVVVIGSVLYYFAAQAWQRRRGLDLSLVYKTIPPD